MTLVPAAGENSAAPAKFSSMACVLIVDDEPLIRWSVAESLEAAGHHIIEAATAQEALQHFEDRSRPIDVAVLDLRLPDSSDLGLMHQIWQVAPQCRIILMTAHETAEILEEALQAGASGVLGKPFDMARIVSLVSEAIEPK
jgi:DNA-binding NtrC family response regulator